MRWLLKVYSGLFKTCDILHQPARTAVYHYALKPKVLHKDDEILSNEEALFKPVAPADKWEHSCSNWDPLIARFIGKLTLKGERETARGVMQLTFREIKLIQLQKLRKAKEEEKPGIIINPIQVFNTAINNCTPLLVLHSIVRGGILYKVPAPPDRHAVATHMAMKFLITASLDKSPTERVWISLANEVIAASENQGRAFRMKVELHKQCEENRAYANYRTY